MHIPATEIAKWATTREAQASLPRLVRRLIHAVEDPVQIAFPAGDSISLPGWDGELTCARGTAWVPRGKSFWELSCEASPKRKADGDYDKRTIGTPHHIRSEATLVIATARRWKGKAEWRKEKQYTGEWAEVRAYDADDLEQWLEQSPAVALQFGHELGLIGQGVESIERQWDAWFYQSDPPISAAALFMGRRNTPERLISDLEHKLQAGQREFYRVKADSVEEAVAYVCAALLSRPDLSGRCLVVTEPSGWQFVARNPSLKAAIATRPEIAERPELRNGLVVVIPYAAGDMEGCCSGAARGDQGPDLTLDRPDIYEFEKALASIGFKEGEARRVARSTGRSWSVLRRHYARNPSIRRPPWLNESQAGALSTVCLLGVWSADNAADREIVARLSGRKYEEIERDLSFLARVEDSPVIKIGSVWKVKAPLELLDLFGDRLTLDEIDRFFRIACEILRAPDPVLDLPEEDRYAAGIYGKVRPQSGYLIQALCDSLVKFAVRGEKGTTLSSANVEGRIAAVVRELLDGADGVRWLSLASLLPSLAEAAPHAFLNALERSMATPEAPVTRLLTETTGPGFMSRCWHAGLLWALEILAWMPEHLTRVSLLLARLAKVEIKGNWGNSPKASLLRIFRTWIPQTAADLHQRIGVLGILVAKEPDIAFDLLDGLVRIGPDSASSSARPRWRDDDAGSGRGVSQQERYDMLIAAADRLIACSSGHPQRIARLIEKCCISDAVRLDATMELTERFAGSPASDEEREIVRTALRKIMHRRHVCNEARSTEFKDRLPTIERLYEKLAPLDLVQQYRWLFSEGWPRLPVLIPADHDKHLEMLETYRAEALREIHTINGMAGIERIAALCTNQPYVGMTLAKLEIETSELADWIVQKGESFSLGEPLTIAINGLLRTLASSHCTELIDAVLEMGKKEGWNAEQTARFFVLAPQDRPTWDIIMSCGAEIENFYWSMVRPGFWLRSTEPDFEFALGRFLAAGRPRSAIEMCCHNINALDAGILVEMLERLVAGEESRSPLPDPWNIGEAVERIEASGGIERDRLVRLEFQLIPLLGYDNEDKAVTLYHAIMSDPKLFAELLCVLYRPAKGECDELASESMEAAVDIAWHVLSKCQRQPGMQQDGTIDRDLFVRFIDETRELCLEADRLKVCDLTLGEILAHAPPDPDGAWPFEPARQVLDRHGLEDMRCGFRTGVINKRGTITRAYDEGGGQERRLADTYRTHANAIRGSHPNAAAVLDEVADFYVQDGLQEDVGARLRREDY